MLKKLLTWALKKKASDEGLTLIELLAVIVILAIIAAIAIPIILVSVNNAKINTTEQDLNIIADALNRYYLDNGAYPKQTTSGNISGVSSDLSPEYLAGVPQDGWGQSFQYQSDGSNYLVETSNSSNYYYVSNASSVTEETTEPTMP
jgi:general secretion pathway protein G